MRRNARRRAEEPKIWENKRFIVGSSIAAIVIAIIAGVAIYTNSSENGGIDDEINPDQIISLAPEEENESTNTQSASSSIGNTVKESQAANTNTNTSTNSKTETEKNNNQATNNVNTNSNSKSTTDSKKQTITTNSNTESEKKVSFEWPVKGEILKAFSIDNLLYSSTLQEWTTHNGIDIKADKASVVVSVADGTVKSIKNDPRYGLTVTIEHANGFKTVYSNLLTAEFVVEGEKVSSGQSIGTVGNSANFEVADDFHLHFEMLKDSEYVDPTIYLK